MTDLLPHNPLAHLPVALRALMQDVEPFVAQSLSKHTLRRMARIGVTSPPGALTMIRRRCPPRPQ